MIAYVADFGWMELNIGFSSLASRGQHIRDVVKVETVKFVFGG